MSDHEHENDAQKELRTDHAERIQQRQSSETEKDEGRGSCC